MIDLNKKKYILTTSLPYVNSIPHIGFGFEILITDTIARFLRNLKKEVFFITGTDENSFKIEIKAKKAGIDTREFCDHFSNVFLELKEKLCLSVDIFYRTSNDVHVRAVNKIISNFDENALYVKKWESYYCQSCESFVGNNPESNSCPLHNTPYRFISEENYFLKIATHIDLLFGLLERNQIEIIPDIYKTESLDRLKYFDDFNVTRIKSGELGVPFFKDNKYVVYAFFEALISYINAVGYFSNEKLFYETWMSEDCFIIQNIGRDILKFHTIYFPLILLAAKIERLPDQIMVHGFVNKNGEKISKSKGNIVSIDELAHNYSSDDIRLYVLSHNIFDDFEFSYDDLEIIKQNSMKSCTLISSCVDKHNLFHASMDSDIDSSYYRGKFIGYISMYKFYEAISLFDKFLNVLNSLDFVDDTNIELLYFMTSTLRPEFYKNNHK